jgi:hypothetical protein
MRSYTIASNLLNNSDLSFAFDVVHVACRFQSNWQFLKSGAVFVILKYLLAW